MRTACLASASLTAGSSVEAVAALSRDSREQVDLQGRPGDRRRRQRGQ